MTARPTITKDRTGNKGDPPPHHKPKPTWDNPPLAVLLLIQPPPRRLHKTKKRTKPKEVVQNARKTKNPSDSTDYK